MTVRPPARRAFTLVEILIVVGIIAIVATAGVPMMWRAMAKDDLARAVNDVIEGCKTARDRAILQSAPQEFVVRADGSLLVEPARVRETARANGAEKPAAPGKPAGAAGSLMGDFPRKFGENIMVELIGVNFIEDMEAPESRVRFHPNGTCDEFSIVLRDRGVQRTIKTDIVTGMAFEVFR